MKKMRKLIPAFAMLMVAAIMMSTASFAWFSMSTTATVSGMQVQATANSSLIITNAINVNAFYTAVQDTTVTGRTDALYPAAPAKTEHDGSLAAPENTNDIDPVTGQLTGDNTLEAITFGDDAEGKYYIDYAVYLSTAGTTALNGKTITATITIPVSIPTINNAVTVDFWTASVVNGAVGNATYQGTTNFKTIADATDGSATTGTVTFKNAVDIPKTFGDKDTTTADGLVDTDIQAVQVIMRVYFNGALEETLTDGSKVTYVRNHTALVDNTASFAVQFDAN